MINLAAPPPSRLLIVSLPDGLYGYRHDPPTKLPLLKTSGAHGTVLRGFGCHPGPIMPHKAGTHVRVIDSQERERLVERMDLSSLSRLNGWFLLLWNYTHVLSTGNPRGPWPIRLFPRPTQR